MRRRGPPRSAVRGIAWALAALASVALAAGGDAAGAGRSFPLADVLDWYEKSNPCNIPRRRNLSRSEFRESFKGRRPVVFGTDPGAFAGITTRERLSETYGSVEVVLSSSNSHSTGRLETTLGDYVDNHMRPQALGTKATQSWYLFGDTRGPAWQELQAQYGPPMDGAQDDPAVSLGVGGERSGVSFHIHGPAYAESIHGDKRWFLAPPDEQPRFRADDSSLSWVAGEYAAAFAAACRDAGGGGAAGTPAGCWSVLRNKTLPSLAECTVGPGEAIYLPPGWWHATLNLGEWNVFVSTFTHEPA